MGFDARYYNAADTEMSLIRQKNSNTADLREAEITKKHPDIAAMRTQLKGTSAVLLSLLADRDESFPERLARLEKDNLALQQQIRQSLVRYGYPEDYLDPVYDCKKCHDTGITDGRRCVCYMEKVKRAAAQDISRTSPLKLCRFEDFSLMYYDDSTVTPLGATARKIMEVNLKTCTDYAENFHLPYNGLVMRGKTGLGKTHLSLSIASAVIEKGYNVIYCSAPDIFRAVNQEYYGKSSGSSDTLGTVIGADLLVLDDVGAEFDSQFYHSMLYTILNDRMNSSLPTIISTNLDHREIEQRYGERTYSRISTLEELYFVGSDVRVKKADMQQS